MIENVEGAPEGIVELRASGTVTGDDYQDVVIPVIEETLSEYDEVRLLYHLGADFESFSTDAALDDAKLGLRHWSSFERLAIVTDVGWIANSARLFAFAMPCPVQVFANDEIDEARRWLQESLGSIHFERDDAQRVARVRLLGRVEPQAYREVTPSLDAFVNDHGRIRLLLDLREFVGWEGLAALRDHLVLVRDHHHAVERVAIVGAREWERQLARIVSRFIDAEARYFEARDLPAAEKWLTGAG